MTAVPIPSRSFVLTLACLAAAACGRPSDFGEPLRLTKEQRPTIWDSPARSRLQVQQMGGARPAPVEVSWSAQAPTGWRELPPEPSRFRTLQWEVDGSKDLDCYLSADVGGGVAGNLQRWYGQFGQAPQPPEGLPTVPFLGSRGRLLELTGTFGGNQAGHAKTIVFAARGEQITSLNLVGPAALVQQSRDKLLSLAASIRRDEGRDEGRGAAHGVGELDAPYSATIPGSWRAGDSSKPLHHTFGAHGEVYVSSLSGQPRMMTDIWRQAMGFEPLTDDQFEALPRCEMLGADAVWLDLVGPLRQMTGETLEGARMIVVLREDAGVITFAKLVGLADEVEAQLGAFRSFCASLRRNS